MTHRLSSDFGFQQLVELAPATQSIVVFSDSAFADDVAKTNLTTILKQHGLENVRSL